MEKKEEFENLKQSLSFKSREIEHLKLQIENQQDVNGSAKQRSPMSPLLPAYPIYEGVGAGSLQPLFQTSTMMAPNCTNSGQGNASKRDAAFVLQGKHDFGKAAIAVNDQSREFDFPVELSMRGVQSEAEELKRKLKLTADICAEQDRRYKVSFTDMEAKLRGAIQARDELLKLRQSESESQQRLLVQLQKAFDQQEKDKSSCDSRLKEVAERLRSSEGLVADLTKELDALKKNSVVLEAVIREEVKQSSAYPRSSSGLPGLDNDVIAALRFYFVHHRQDKEILNFKLKKLQDQYEQLLVEKEKMESRIRDDHDVVIKVMQDELAAKAKEKDVALEAALERLRVLEGQAELIKVSHGKEVAGLQDELRSAQTLLENTKHAMEAKVNGLEMRLADSLSANDSIAAQNRTLEANIQILSKDSAAMKLKINDLDLAALELRSANEQLQARCREHEAAYNELKSLSEISKVKLEAALSVKDEKIKGLLAREERLMTDADKQSVEALQQVRLEERERYHYELRDIGAVIDEYKKVLESTKLELESKEEYVQECRREIGVKESEIKSLREDRAEMDEVIKILRQEAEEKDRALKGNVHIASRLVELENVVSGLRSQLDVARDELSHKLEEVKRLESKHLLLVQDKENAESRAGFLQQEVTRLLNVVEGTNNEVGELQYQRKLLAKKLKQREEKCSRNEVEHAKLLHDHEQTRKNLSNLEDQYKRVTDELALVRQDLGLVNREKDALTVVVEGQAESRDKEIAALVTRLRGSEDDLLQMKKILQTRGSSDSKVLKVASVTQVLVTKQRAEIDALRTKCNWLKEALEVSERTRESLNQQLEATGSSLNSFMSDRSKLKEDNMALARLAENCQLEASHLRQALERAALKYAEVQSFVDKQEKLLNEERRQHASDVLKLREMLAEVKPAFVEQVVTGQSSTVPSVQSAPERKPEVYHELQGLLHEVKGMLVATLAKQSRNTDRYDGDRRREKRRESGASDEQSVSNISVEGEHTRKLNEYLDSQSSSYTSLHLNHISSVVSDSHYSVSSLPPPKASSPKDHAIMAFHLDSNEISGPVGSDRGASKRVTVLDRKDTARNGRGSVEMTRAPLNKLDEFSDDSHVERVKTLQDKLVSLQKLGNELSTRNKETALLLKDHSRKISKVRKGHETKSR